MFFSSILFQRGIYAAETFKVTRYHGLPVYVTDDKDLGDYISNILKQIKGS